MLWWSDDLKTGIKAVDEQHKSIFDMVGDLLNIEDPKDKKSVIEVIGFLLKYVANHFRDEEDAMIKSEYPDYEKHKKEHKAFTEKLNLFVEEITNSGINEQKIDQLKLMVIEWLIVHISDSDKEFARFYLPLFGEE